jgi:6-phosphogluconolactonase (cycloisomerase 2 family)
MKPMRDAILLLCISAAMAGCGGSSYGGTGTGPTPTPPIPAGIYYVNGGTSPNKVPALSSAPIASGSQPSPLPGSPFSTNTENGSAGAPFGMALAKGGSVLYVVNSNAGSVSTFPVNADGTLGTPLAPVSTGGTSPSGVCVDPTSLFAAAVNTTSPSVQSYTIGAGGALAATGAAVSSGGITSPQACAFSADSKYLYVTNGAGAGGVSGYSVAPGTGVLAMLPGSPYNLAGSHPCQGIALTSTALFATNFAENQVTAFLIPGTGQLQSATPFGTAISPSSLAISPNGKYLYVATPGAQAVDGYSVNGFALARLAGAPYPTQATKTAMVTINSAGTLLAALDEQAPGVTLFAVKSDGTLGFAPQNEYTLPALAGQNPMAIVLR